MVLEAAQIILSDNQIAFWSSPIIHTVALKGHHYISFSLHYINFDLCEKNIMWLCIHNYLACIHDYLACIHKYLACLHNYVVCLHNYCPACRTSLIARRFWVVVICPIIKCVTVLEFSFILFDLCLFITIFNFILNYVPNYLFFNMFGSVLECCELTGVSLLWPWPVKWK